LNISSPTLGKVKKWEFWRKQNKKWKKSTTKDSMGMGKEREREFMRRFRKNIGVVRRSMGTR